MGSSLAHDTGAEIDVKCVSELGREGERMTLINVVLDFSFSIIIKETIITQPRT